MDIMQRAVQVRNDMPLAVGIEKVDSMTVKIASETTQTEAVFDVVVISYSPKSETVKVHNPSKLVFLGAPVVQ